MCACVCSCMCVCVHVCVCMCECVITKDYSNGLLLSHQSTTNQRTEVQSISIKRRINGIRFD